jgi:hypothetical protein
MVFRSAAFSNAGQDGGILPTLSPQEWKENNIRRYQPSVNVLVGSAISLVFPGNQVAGAPPDNCRLGAI